MIVDVHTRLDPAEAIRFCRGIEPFDPFFVEDPVRSESPQALRKLNQQVSVPIGMGEQYATKWEFRQVVEEDLIDYARIDLCIVGGLTEALKVAHWCETHYIQVAPIIRWDRSPRRPACTWTWPLVILRSRNVPGHQVRCYLSCFHSR